ncbi:MAG: hypothetical protein IJU54_00675 [Alphaproteobacteria bacterium]|nr:hypothetical protein [Alphaproteobacteria bacterium]
MKKYTIVICTLFLIHSNCFIYAKKNDVQKGMEEASDTTDTISAEGTKIGNSIAKFAKNIKGIFKEFDDEEDDKKESKSCDYKLKNAINDTNNKLQNILNTRWNSVYDMQSALSRVQNELNAVTNTNVSNMQTHNNINKNNNITNNNQNGKLINSANNPKIRIVQQTNTTKPKNNFVTKLFRSNKK